MATLAKARPKKPAGIIFFKVIIWAFNWVRPLIGAQFRKCVRVRLVVKIYESIRLVHLDSGASLALEYRASNSSRNQARKKPATSIARIDNRQTATLKKSDNLYARKTRSASPMNSINRRNFLKTAGAAVVLPTILPSSVLGRGGKAPPSGKITMASSAGAARTGRRAIFLRTGRLPNGRRCDVDKNRSRTAVSTINRYYGNTDCALLSGSP